MSIDLVPPVLLPFLIFFSRIADVSLGTVRIILVSKSYKLYAAVLGFFEVLIWILVISKLMAGATHPSTYIAYAFGFAMGTYIGMLLEEKIAIGTFLLQLISHSNKKALLDDLNKKHIKTFSNAEILYVIVTRKNYRNVANLIKLHDPKAFFSVEDISIVQEDLEHMLEVGKVQSLTSFFRRHKKRV